MRANELNQKYLSIFITADGHTSFTDGPANSPDMAPNKCHCPFPFRWRMMAGMNTEWVHRYIVILSNCQANCAGALLPSREVLFCSSSFDFLCQLWLSFFVLPAKWKDKIITRWDSRFFSPILRRRVCTHCVCCRCWSRPRFYDSVKLALSVIPGESWKGPVKTNRACFFR